MVVLTMPRPYTSDENVMVALVPSAGLINS